MGWALIYDDQKKYYDLKINDKNKTFITAEEIGDFSGIIEMLKYTLGTEEDNDNIKNNDPNFTLSSPVFSYLETTDPKGSRLTYILKNSKGQNLLKEVKAECERATKYLLDKKFKNNKICEFINFNPKIQDNNIILDITIFFTDNSSTNITQVLNNL